MTKMGLSPNDGIVRARQAGAKNKNGIRYSTGQFSIPSRMMRQIPEGARFRAEWHEDGILYRFLGVEEINVVPDAPEWAKA